MAISLKAARFNSGLTQKEAAKKIGVSADTLGNYERDIPFPDVPIIEKIQMVYGVSYKDIFFA